MSKQEKPSSNVEIYAEYLISHISDLIICLDYFQNHPAFSLRDIISEKKRENSISAIAKYLSIEESAELCHAIQSVNWYEQFLEVQYEFTMI